MASTTHTYKTISNKYQIISRQRSSILRDSTILWRISHMEVGECRTQTKVAVCLTKHQLVRLEPMWLIHLLRQRYQAIDHQEVMINLKNTSQVLGLSEIHMLTLCHILCQIYHHQPLATLVPNIRMVVNRWIRKAHIIRLQMRAIVMTKETQILIHPSSMTTAKMIARMRKVPTTNTNQARNKWTTTASNNSLITTNKPTWHHISHFKVTTTLIM